MRDCFVPCWRLLCCENKLTFWSTFPMHWCITTKVRSLMQHGNPHLLMRPKQRPNFKEKKIIWGQIVRENKNVKDASFEKWKSNWNQSLVHWYNMGKCNGKMHKFQIYMIVLHNMLLFICRFSDALRALYKLIYQIFEGLVQGRTICILAILRKLALMIFTYNVF